MAFLEQKTPIKDVDAYIKKAKQLKANENMTELQNEYWDKLHKRTLTYCADIYIKNHNV